jgi:hypothetical protein
VASKLQLYNNALLIVGERELASLTETREPRRLLDQVWNGGGVNYCLEQGQWYFSLRSVMLDFDPAEDPQFGWTYAFSKPDDWLKTSAITTDERFWEPLQEFAFENGLWFADVTPIYVRYVSSGTSYGGNIGDWPEPFFEFASAYFASKIVRKLAPTREAEVMEDLKKAKHEAKSHGMMAQPNTYFPTGRWARHRRGRMNREGGNRNGPLIG